jgi:hypothetical protein
MMRRLTTAILPVALLTATSPAALAAWTSVGDASGSVTAASVSAGNLPAANRVVTSETEGSVGLSWTASTLASGDPVTHYDVLRSDGVTACAGATTTSCSDTSPVPGPVSYAVVPRIGANWTGPQSAAAPFQFDVYAPATTVERTPVPNESGWDNDTVRVTLTADDPGPVASGVRTIHYTINGGPEIVVTGGTAEFDVTEENQHSIAFWAEDNLGNTEGPGGTEDVSIDRTAPVSTGTLSGDQASLSAIDSGGSGLAYIEYRIGSSGAYSTYTAPVTLSDGRTIYFRAVDVAGNVETPDKSLTYAAPVTDTDAPSTTLASGPAPNAAGWTTADTTLTLTSTDNVGVTKLEWRVGPSGTVTTITGAGPFTVGPFTTEGTTNVQYRAVDAAGNAEGWKTYDVKIDRTVPTVGITFPLASVSGNNAWRQGCGTSGNQTVNFDICGSAADGHSGVAKVEFRLESGASCLQATGQANGVFTSAACSARLAASVPGVGGHQWSAVTGDIVNGTYTLTVWVTNAAGLEQSTSRTFTKS